jgi:hypothetical protein
MQMHLSYHHLALPRDNRSFWLSFDFHFIDYTLDYSLNDNWINHDLYKRCVVWFNLNSPANDLLNCNFLIQFLKDLYENFMKRVIDLYKRCKYFISSRRPLNMRLNVKNSKKSFWAFKLDYKLTTEMEVNQTLSSISCVNNFLIHKDSCFYNNKL